VHLARIKADGAWQPAHLAERGCASRRRSRNPAHELCGPPVGCRARPALFRAANGGDHPSSRPRRGRPAGRTPGRRSRPSPLAGAGRGPYSTLRQGRGQPTFVWCFLQTEGGPSEVAPTRRSPPWPAPGPRPLGEPAPKRRSPVRTVNPAPRWVLCPLMARAGSAHPVRKPASADCRPLNTGRCTLHCHSRRRRATLARDLVSTFQTAHPLLAPN